MANIAVGSMRVGRLAKALIRRTLDENRLTYGPLTERFEREFAECHGCRHGLFTVSGTSALEVALRTLKILHHWQDGDEVLVPSVSFIATSNVVILNQLRPVFVDIDRDTYNMDPAEIEARITPRTRAIMPVHLFSQTAEMDRIMAIARRHALKVVTDSCQTMLVEYKGKPLGHWGDIVCFSTYAAHLLVTGVGGLSITNNARYAAKMRSLVNHGRDTIYFNIDQDDRLSAKDLFRVVNRRFAFVDVGYSYRLTEMEAALGIEGLQRLMAGIRRRRSNYRRIVEGLARHEAYLKLPTIRDWSSVSCMMVPLAVRERSGIRRADLVAFLEAHGIETRYAMPVLSQPAYRKLYPGLEGQYPVARWLDRHGFYIGCHQYLSAADIQHIVRMFEEFFRKKSGGKGRRRQ